MLKNLAKMYVKYEICGLVLYGPNQNKKTAVLF